jgi:hypothetical protein
VPTRIPRPARDTLAWEEPFADHLLQLDSSAGFPHLEIDRTAVLLSDGID